MDTHCIEPLHQLEHEQAQSPPCENWQATNGSQRPSRRLSRPTLDQLKLALTASWTADTSANPTAWSPTRPSAGQCDVTSLVIRHYLGGDLVLAKVFIDCVQTEYHWWNRFPTGDVDLTLDQFYPHQDVIEFQVFDEAAVAAAGPMRPDLLERFDRLLRSVTQQLHSS